MANFVNTSDRSIDINSLDELDFYTVLTLAREDDELKNNSELFLEIDDEKKDSQGKMIEDQKKRQKIREHIRLFVEKENFKVKGINTKAELVKRLFDEFVDFSILTDYIRDENNEIEEINVNAWNDVEVRYSSGEVKKVEHFCNEEHAIHVIRRLSTAINSKIDESVPMGEGSLTNNIRIVTLSKPIVDNDVSAACSIRLLKQQKANRDFFIQNNTITEEELKFLETAIKSGVSIIFVGETGCGKTTLMNYLLSTIPNNKRIVTIEHNARELSLVKKDENNNIINNVVHLKTMEHSNAKFKVTQEDLLIKALRLDPHVICVGEMRDSEAYAAQEASLTGHTVVTSLHADGVQATHFRVAMLALKRYEVDINIALLQAQMAFPIIVYLSKLEDNSRRVMEISECSIIRDGVDVVSDYTTLFKYSITENSIDKNGNAKIVGEHISNAKISNDLAERMLRNGASRADLEQFGYKFDLK